MLTSSRFYTVAMLYLQSTWFGMLLAIAAVLFLVGKDFYGPHATFFERVVPSIPFFLTIIILYALTLVVLSLQHYQHVRWGMLFLAPLIWISFIATGLLRHDLVVVGVDASIPLLLPAAVLYSVGVLYSTFVHRHVPSAKKHQRSNS